MSNCGDAHDRSASRRRRDAARRWAWSAVLSTGLLTVQSGCQSRNNWSETVGNDTTWVDRVSAEVDVGAPPTGPINDPLIQPVTLRTLEEQGDPEYWDVSLNEIVAHAMANSKVLRDLGGTILSAPTTVATQFNRGLQQTDPRFGMDAALSQFDAQLNSLATFQHNHRVYNNRFLGGGANFFRQERHDYVSELSKYSATGAQFALRNTMDYDDNNAPGNLFGSAWQTQWEGEVRQPLLQGAGLSYNRIAGPSGMPGVPNGVLIAKVNQDMTAADFNLAIRNYLSDVVNAYWDLYFAYRDLDSKQQALERSREIWQAYEAEKVADRKGGVAEALAREQFFRFQSELEDAIAGRTGQRTQNRNGATGGSFRGVNGVQAAERRLRMLVGLPVNDVRVIRPNDDPELAPVVFEWESMAGEAVHRRPELQKQRLLLKRREMELIAARNFLQPQLDVYGKYRLRGLGHDLYGNDQRDGLRSAYGELGSAEFREWELGLQFNMPIGFRQGHAAVQNAELQLSRDRAILHEQERQVLHDLSNMVAEVDRAWKQCQTNLNRYLAAKDAVAALEANRESGLPVNLEQVLDAQRRLSESQSQYYLSRTEYALAIKNVHLEKGSLFEYSNVLIADNRPQASHSAEGETSRSLLAGANGSVDFGTKPAVASSTEPTPMPAVTAAVSDTAAAPPAPAIPADEAGGRVSISLVDPVTAKQSAPQVAQREVAAPSADLAPAPFPTTAEAETLFGGDRPTAAAEPATTSPRPAIAPSAGPKSRQASAANYVPLPPSSTGIQPTSFNPSLFHSSDTPSLLN
ncbi:MAG: TolC family protein [Planctomycetaceae bacterium]